jgi:uncharacterized protein DUF6544
MNRTDLRALYDSVPEATQRFDPAKIADLPIPVQRYLLRAIAPGTPLASAVRLRMHGSIRLSRWRAFKAEQVIVRGRGMIWRARVRMGPLALRGFDRYLDGEGSMLWRVFGVVPIVRARGRDVTRSAADRFAAESIWLPSRFCIDPVSWSVDGSDVLHARFTVDGREEDLTLTTSAGSLQSVAMKRWGNPEGRPFRDYDFGALVEQEARFGGYTIPARVRVGWHFGSARFEEAGEFFRATIDEATFR